MSTATIPVSADSKGVCALHLRRLVVPLPECDLQVNDWQIRAGEKVAIIGRNGVGKTSLMEAILGLRATTATDGDMLGIALDRWQRRPALRRQLGVQLQRAFFPGRPRVGEMVALHRSLYRRTSERVLDALGIPALAPRLYEFLSRGETQRVELFLALAHEPRILFLDEPFTGLDPRFAHSLRALLGEMCDTTVVMCCHTVEELALATHTAWLSREGIVRHEATEVLCRDLVGAFRLTVQCKDEQSAQDLALDLQGHFTLERAPVVEQQNLSLASSTSLAEIANALMDHPDALAVDVGRGTLADLLRHCAKGA
ncbi:ATP-binding cassette domain-containing protein [Variovorax sp. J2P1-59]|uniref:ATP-binding cassette domain-containing protein n=1 Tax=Variovorax flavidus TaxID=3053501 RepID=UPI002574F283|nr:ATP-binding cassette domain-containing protein [Variovorax sp. J2P1-59]MDM0077526.1 ATP-binding cassette domain-containing protein [Variovorax sp. J2P1-59]